MTIQTGHGERLTAAVNPDGAPSAATRAAACPAIASRPTRLPDGNTEDAPPADIRPGQGHTPRGTGRAGHTATDRAPGTGVGADAGRGGAGGGSGGVGGSGRGWAAWSGGWVGG